MLFFMLACQATKSSQNIDDIALGTDSGQDSIRPDDCFHNVPPEPFIVYSTPYDENGNQSMLWHLQDSAGLTEDFEMGRATFGQIHLSADGSWGAVAQSDGSIGVFRYLDGAVSIVDVALTLVHEGEEVYASQLWLDSAQGVLWVTDQNWPENGGGLFKAGLDCETGEVISVDKVFSSKNAYSVRPLDDHWVFLSREVNELPFQLSVFDHEGNILSQGHAFNDDEAIFSALSSDGRHILVGDNNAFSGTPNRISHMIWDGETLIHEGSFDVEDPMSIVMIDDWALIASGFGDSLWQYNLSNRSLVSVMSLPLPSLVVRQGNTLYAVGNTQIQKLSISDDGLTPENEVLSLSGLSGVVGAAGIYGVY